ncbi:BTAD domain-containing putative transcriptional regulator [Streptomyces sp. B21-083]|uniref:BTAD domain-containing putative transcriptional regulator n=1 Tax=Streptomyces sp. B21-083 TaxID=3039410 RepID=UPI002FF0192D
MDHELASFSAELGARRKRAGLTQKQLADQAGVSVRTVRAIECGQVRRPHTSSLRMLGSVLGLEGSDVPSTGCQVEVLGPLVVRRDGQVVQAGGVKQRSLLAVLALRCNDIVSQAEIIDVLWGDSPPATCRELLYGYISRLRKALGAERIEARSGSGYRLVADIHELDVLRFDALVAAGDWEAALRCWRGAVLADLPDLVRKLPRALTLTEQRLATGIAHADALIAAGAHGGAVPGLRALVADEPLHEELCARLMVALAGCGQQGAALELYESLRNRLSTELGVSPGASLRQAHLRVLRQEIPAAGALRQLPAPPPGFTGRASQLAALDHARDAGTMIAAIGGAGGTGKTWLALTWAHQNSARFPDGQLYVNLRGYDPASPPLPVETALHGFLRALGVDPTAVPPDIDGMAALYRSLLAERNVLVLLDNARDADHVTPLLPSSTASAVLVTSRSGLPELVATHGAWPITLDPLNGSEARDLLAYRLSAPRLAAEPDAAAAVVHWCSGLPLALGIVIARATRASLTELAAELSSAHTRLSALDAGAPSANLRVVLDISHAALSSAAARLFRQLSITPGPDIGTRAAIAVAGPGAPVLLRELADAHLVDEHMPDRYRMHDLVRLYAAEKCGEAERDSALGQTVEHYLHSALACAEVMGHHRLPSVDQLPAPGSNPYRPGDMTAALAWTEAEHAALTAVVDLQLPGVSWQLPKALAVYHWRYGRLRDHLAMWTTAREVAERIGDVTALVQADISFGDSHATLGDFPTALPYLERAVALAAQLGDLAAEADAHNSLAWAWEGRRNHRKALDHARAALTGYQALGKPHLEADMLNCVGWCLIRLGRRDEGRAWCDKALALCEEHGHRDGIAHTLRSLGELELETGRYREAVRRLQIASDLLALLQHGFAQAGVLARLGEAAHALGRDDLARSSWERALGLYRAQHREVPATRVLSQLASLD